MLFHTSWGLLSAPWPPAPPILGLFQLLGFLAPLPFVPEGASAFTFIGCSSSAFICHLCPSCHHLPVCPSCSRCLLLGRNLSLPPSDPFFPLLLPGCQCLLSTTWKKGRGTQGEKTTSGWVRLREGHSFHGAEQFKQFNPLKMALIGFHTLSWVLVPRK